MMIIFSTGYTLCCPTSSDISVLCLFKFKSSKAIHHISTAMELGKKTRYAAKFASL